MRFYKYCGAGNDFVLLDDREQRLKDADLPALAERLCTLHFGVGADGMMVVRPPEGEGDCRMLFFNNDGSTAEMCGNGARCICRYCHDAGISGEMQRIETTAGLVIGQRIAANQYRIQLNSPGVIDLQRMAAGTLCDYVELGSPGIPHCVVPVEKDASRDELRELARRMRHAAEFPKGANVNLWHKDGENAISLLTFERGVEDFTLACGTGAGATVMALTCQGIVSGKNTSVHVEGGVLSVDISGKEIYLTGPADHVFTGDLPELRE